MKILGHKPSFSFGQRNTSNNKSSSETGDEDGAPILTRLITTVRSAPATPRRQSLKEAWASLKKVVKKRASLPEFLSRRNTTSAPATPVEPVAPPTPTTPSASPTLSLERPSSLPSYREIAVRTTKDTDEEEAAFCDCIFELMKRCPKYHRYLDQQTKAQLVLEGRADRSIFNAGSSEDGEESEESEESEASTDGDSVTGV